MKRNISDLLDQYPAEDFGLDGETPYSKSRIKELTMNNIKTDRPDKKFKPARLLVAAAAAAKVICRDHCSSRTISPDRLRAQLLSMGVELETTR